MTKHGKTRNFPSQIGYLTPTRKRFLIRRSQVRILLGVLFLPCF